MMMVWLGFIWGWLELNLKCVFDFSIIDLVLKPNGICCDGDFVFVFQFFSIGVGLN